MSEPRSYDLLCKPWLPVVWQPDAVEPREPKIGIREAVKRAYELKCISHTAPFIEFGLYRLLITIVLDAYIVAGKRPTIEKMKAILEAKQFDASVLGKYLEGYKERFHLWAEDYSFLQSAPTNKVKPAPVVTMFPAFPSGANPVHWHHAFENDMALGPEVAAQFLTTVSCFTFKGKVGAARTLAGDPPMYALVLGHSLFETIVYNLPRPSGRITTKQECDQGPAWRTRLDCTHLPKVPTVAQGFTWPVRRIKLEYSEDAIENAAYVVAYKKTETTKINAPVYDVKNGWRDPNAGTETTKDSITHIKARPGVPVWRDAVPLFLLTGVGEALGRGGRRSRPEVVTNALRILETPKFRVAVYGMRKKSGGGDVKVEEWFRSVLTLPTEVARDTRLSARAIDAFKTTQKVADTLHAALRMLRPPVKASKNKRRASARGETDSLADFWHSLEPVLTQGYLDALASNEPSAETELWSTVHRAAHRAFAAATGPHRRTADGLFRIANASNWLGRKLARLLPKPKSQENR